VKKMEKIVHSSSIYVVYYFVAKKKSAEHILRFAFCMNLSRLAPVIRRA
jgi:hypothetical protein